MKKRLLLLLVAMIGMATSVGWAQSTTAEINTDLKVAQKGKPIVFGITSKKGNVPDNQKVHISIKADNNAFDGWEPYYYEPNTSTPGWIKWDPKNENFDSGEGIPFQDAT